MKLTITLHCDNDAFENFEGEVARILRDLATRLEHGITQRVTLRDANGNTVGTCDVDTEGGAR